jgi:hypothetical protein
MDDAPTPRSSGSLAVFEQTVTEAIQKLDACAPNDDSAELRQEAVALQALFRSWRVRTPGPEDKERTSAITRLMALHRAVEEHLAARVVR